VKHLQVMDFLQTSTGKFLRKSHLSGRNRQKLMHNRLIALRDFEHATGTFNFRLCSHLV